VRDYLRGRATASQCWWRGGLRLAQRDAFVQDDFLADDLLARNVLSFLRADDVLDEFLPGAGLLGGFSLADGENPDVALALWAEWGSFGSRLRARSG
jgi:hypothetical protein